MDKELWHFIGIGGIGMSALAKLLLEQGCTVSGSDQKENSQTKQLHALGAQISIGHCRQEFDPEMHIVISSSIPSDNQELLHAKSRGCRVHHRSALLAHLMEKKKALVVVGTHGKTTTSSLLAWVLKHSGYDPSFAVGGMIPKLNTNAATGSGAYFVAEGDESDGTFERYKPFGSIITNIGLDHMEHYKEEKNLSNAFGNYIRNIQNPDLLVWCGDDRRLRSLSLQGMSYGFHHGNTLRGSFYRQKGWKSIFTIDYEGKTYADIEIPLVGRHMALNAMAVFGLCFRLGIAREQIEDAFRTFPGVSRRSEKIGEVHQILIIDDYAHHPTEIKATLEGLREAEGLRKLIAVYQPHRYTRTAACFSEITAAFQAADEVVVTDIYAAGEDSVPGIDAEMLSQAIFETSHVKTRYVPRCRLLEDLRGYAMPHDMVVTLGAGDITLLGRELVRELEPAKPKLTLGVLKGGRSAEHAISLISAKNILAAIPRDIYEICNFTIDPRGNWSVEGKQCDGGPFPQEVFTALNQCDLFFPVCHGPYGEDGSLQGFFEMVGKPYIGMNWRSAAVSMDKILTKRILNDHNIPNAPFVGVSQQEWSARPERVIEHINQTLSFPVIVKPSHLGSSVGLSKVESLPDLSEAINNALQFDHDILVERFIAGREIEFAVIGNHDVEVFPPGEVLTGGRLYDYDAKYSNASFQVTSKAELSQELIEEGKKLVEKTFRILGGEGMARIDTFLDVHGKYWVNEVNPIPGFTSQSLYPRICEENGYPMPKLIDRLVKLALGRHRRNLKKEEFVAGRSA